MIPEGPRVYISPNEHLSAYLSRYRSPYPRTVNCSGKEITLGEGDPYLELKFRMDLALDYDGKRPPHSVMAHILKEGIPDYLDFLQKLQIDPELKKASLIYASSNTVMSEAAKRHGGFNIEKIEDPERDKIFEEDPDYAGATHDIYATPEELVAQTKHIERLVERTKRWKTIPPKKESAVLKSHQDFTESNFLTETVSNRETATEFSDEVINWRQRFTGNMDKIMANPKFGEWIRSLNPSEAEKVFSDMANESLYNTDFTGEEDPFADAELPVIGNNEFLPNKGFKRFFSNFHPKRWLRHP